MTCECGGQLKLGGMNSTLSELQIVIYHQYIYKKAITHYDIVI